MDVHYGFLSTAYCAIAFLKIDNLSTFLFGHQLLESLFFVYHFLIKNHPEGQGW